MIFIGIARNLQQDCVRLQVTTGDDKSGVIRVPLPSVGWEGVYRLTCTYIDMEHTTI